MNYYERRLVLERYTFLTWQKYRKGTQTIPSSLCAIVKDNGEKANSSQSKLMKFEILLRHSRQEELV